MIIGTVNARNELVIGLPVQDVAGQGDLPYPCHDRVFKCLRGEVTRQIDPRQV